VRIGRRATSWLIVLGVGITGGAAASSEIGAAGDRLLAPLRFAAIDRKASGQVVVVEMDAASAATIKRWPWSRTNYAEVVDRLHAAGAASIVFDVEFSSASDPADDARFAAAIARANGTVALPTFGQAASAADRRTIDALPIPILAKHAALASVSVAPDPDGQVRSMPFATVTDGTPRPSLSAFIAARSGKAEETFPIDMAIDPAAIPRLSFIAVRDGRFDPAMVKGRNVLIGATAVEMGDRYGTPRWGVIPGVIVQALAAETLLAGVPIEGDPFVPLAAALLIAGLMVRQRSAARVGIAFAGGTVATVALVLAAQQWWLLSYPLAASLLGITVCGAACFGRAIAGRFSAQRLVDEESGLPNARALVTEGEWTANRIVAVAEIDNYDSLHAVLGADATQLVVRVSERLALVAEDARVHRAADRRLAMRLSADVPIDDMLDGLRVVMMQPIEVAGRRVDVMMSVGVADGPARETERLLTEAIMAADQARQAEVFWRRADTDIDDLTREVSLMGELDAAIETGEIEVHYQPKQDLKLGRITSVEALVRWRHPVRGFVGPDLFIPTAERTNRIGTLTLHVLDHVLRDLSGWRARHPGITAAVNVSAKLLHDAAFNDEVEALIARHGVPTSALVFEVTESAAMADPAAAVAALQRYRAMGIAVSMDDYGTGQSTLTYIRELPLNELKIDRSFVQHAHKNRNDAVLVRSTVDLAHELGLKVVAEGVEDAECLAFLRACGCDLAQGYFISRPVPLAALLTLVEGQALAA